MSYTPDLNKFACRMGIHNWDYRFGIGNRYFECKNCPKRKVERKDSDHTPIDFAWLRGGTASKERK